MSTDYTPTKRCSKCGEFKAWSEFSKHKRRKDGYQSRCKNCENESHARYRAQNPDIIRERNKQYRSQNPDKCRELTKQWNIQNRDDVKRYRNLYYIRNRDEILEYQSRYRAENADAVHERIKRWRIRNFNKIREYQARYHTANRSKARANQHLRRARKRAAEGTHSAADMREQFTRQKGICYYCDCKLINPFKPKPKTTVKRIAHWEHIIPLVRGGRNDLSNLVWACADCNLSKGAKLLGIEWQAPNGRLI